MEVEHQSNVERYNGVKLHPHGSKVMGDWCCVQVLAELLQTRVRPQNVGRSD